MIFKRFPVYNIDRVEIIRGAGSAIYGGQAGLAVINVITKQTNNKQEIGFSTTLGATGNAWNTAIMEGYALTKFKSGLAIDISASFNYGKQTDRNFTGGLTSSYINNAQYSTLSSNNLNVGVRYKQLSVRFVSNKYFTINPHFGNTKVNMSGNFLTFGYVFNLNPRLSIYTKASLKQQVPYYFTDIPDLPASVGVTGKMVSTQGGNLLENRLLANVYAVYKPIENLTISAGTEVFSDRSAYFATEYRFRDSSRVAQFTNIGAFAEANLRSKIVNLTVGARMDKYGDINPVVVPRIALTRAFEKLHFKALYTEAFKTPSIHNIKFARIGTKTLPERYRLIEFEAGFRLGSKLQVSANVYDMYIRNFITRKDLSTSGFEFVNTGDVGTQGIEGEAKYKMDKLEVQVGYSFYRVSKNNPEREIRTLPTVSPGIPAQKATLRVSVDITKNLTANLTFIHLTNKLRNSDIDIKVIEEFPNEQHLNLNLQYNDFLIKNLSLAAGCVNVLDQKHHFVSWKRDFSATIYLPAQGREFLIRLIYQIKG
jgi:outer membrane receptor protein involved in Fe transport